jgi:hypothetical protein
MIVNITALASTTADFFTSSQLTADQSNESVQKT